MTAGRGRRRPGSRRALAAPGGRVLQQHATALLCWLCPCPISQGCTVLYFTHTPYKILVVKISFSLTTATILPAKVRERDPGRGIRLTPRIFNTEIHISFLGKECVFRGSFLRHAARRTPPLVVRRGAMASATRVHAPCLPCSTPQRAVSARSSRAISQRAVSARREPSAREATEAQPNVQRVTRETPRTGRPSCAK